METPFMYPRSSIVEPLSQLYKMFDPIDPTTIQLVISSIWVKYFLFLGYFILSPLIDALQITQFIQDSFLLLLVLDLLLMVLIVVSTNENSTIKNLINRVIIESYFLMYLLTMFEISGVQLGISRFILIFIQYSLIFTFYFVNKEDMIKPNDTNEGVYPFTGSVMVIFWLFVYLMAFLQPFVRELLALHHFQSSITILLIGYLFYVNLIVSGPNEYMDKESMYRLTDLSCFIFFLLIIGSLLVANRFDLSKQMLYLQNYLIPIILFNLFGKFKGYIFRSERLVHGATMAVDKTLFEK